MIFLFLYFFLGGRYFYSYRKIIISVLFPLHKNIKFIRELFKLDMLLGSIMDGCVDSTIGRKRLWRVCANRYGQWAKS